MSNPEDFVDEKGGDKGGNLDPLKTKQIHGSKPTNHKKIGSIFGGEFSN